MVVKIAAATSSNKPQPNPWEALISSATRARPTRPVLLTTAFSGESDDGSDNTSSLSSSAGGGGGYTILLQHSLTPKSQRKWALESTMAAVDKSTNSSNNINSGTRSNNTAPSSSSSLRSRSGGGGDWYGISGPFLVRQALYDLSTRCNGRVVFVSVAGTTGILDLDALQDNTDASSSSSSSSVHLFLQNGACVDLSSNPFGWNDEDNNNCNNNSFVTKATMSNLQSLASAIRQAASNIIISRSKDEAIDNISQDQKSKSEGNLQLQQPIPIIFETMTPLLQLHGVERINVLLKSLGRMTILDNNGNNNNKSSNTSSVLSPIIVPVLYESICLSDHRTLEDCADAIVSLKLMDTATSATTSIDVLEAKDDKDIVVVTGVMDLVRRGGGGGGNGGLGGKLMRHCVPIHILRSKITTNTMGDLRNSCYWIVGSDDKDNTRQEGEEGDDVTQKGKTEMRSSHNTALDQSQTALATPKSSRPQIYLQDDDPDFQDYDEDDDLDL